MTNWEVLAKANNTTSGKTKLPSNMMRLLFCRLDTHNVTHDSVRTAGKESTRAQAGPGDLLPQFNGYVAQLRYETNEPDRLIGMASHLSDAFDKRLIPTPYIELFSGDVTCQTHYDQDTS